MTISPIALRWGFATDAENTSLGVRNDGSVVSTFVSNSFLDYHISAAYGQITVNDGNPEFTFWGTDVNFDSGDAPASVAIDPTGLAVSIHEKNGPGSTLYLNIGTANGGQGGFNASSYETSNNGSNPSIICIGAGLFIVTANIWQDAMYAWQLQIFQPETGGYNINMSEIAINIPQGMANASTAAFPVKAAYSNGVLALLQYNGEGYFLMVGSYETTGATFNVQCAYALSCSLDISEQPPFAGTFGPDGTLYYATAGKDSQGNGTIIFNTVTIDQGDPWTCQFSQETILQDVNNGNYANAVDMGYITLDGYSGIVMTVLGESNCIDVFTIPSSQLS